MIHDEYTYMYIHTWIHDVYMMKPTNISWFASVGMSVLEVTI